MLVILPNPISELQHTPLPQSVANQRTCPQFLILSLSSNSHLNLSKRLGAHQTLCNGMAVHHSSFNNNDHRLVNLNVELNFDS